MLLLQACAPLLKSQAQRGPGGELEILSEDPHLPSGGKFLAQGYHSELRLPATILLDRGPGEGRVQATENISNLNFQMERAVIHHNLLPFGEAGSV